jgi:sigma-B regulation protein RsbU (phosphoserine phosphatase)
VAGDYYDAILLDEHRILFAIADVTGKGIPASLLMSNLQATLRILVSIDVSLEEGTAHMNRVITENTGFDKFITYFHGIYDRRDRSFTYVNAGHNPVMLVRHDGTLELLETGGLLLGVIPGATYEKGRVILGQGDILAFFTDGITEAMSPQGEEWGEERLEPLLIEARHASAQDILDRVRSAVADFTEHAPVLSDDVTMLVVKAT